MINKTYWIRGEWDDEPDRVSFKVNGYKCRIKRNPELGHLCGYVYLPLGHPFYGLNTSHELSLPPCHGGITFSGTCPNGTWAIGFDCGHYDDLCPGYVGLGSRSSAAYRNIAYVKNELTKLAVYLKLKEVAPDLAEEIK